MKNWTIKAKLMLAFFISIIMTILNIVFSELTTRMAANYSGEALKTYNRNASIFTYSVGIVSIIIILWVATILIRQIRMSVEELSNAAKQIAMGRVDIQIKKFSNDELGQLVDEYEKVIQNIKNQAHIAEEVANGNLTISVTPASSDDLLGNSLKKLVEDNYHALSNISDSGTQVTISSSQVASASQALAQYDIEFKDVSFKYHEHSEEVLKHLSFTIKQGNRVGIIGGTGAGKSSLVQLIPRLYDASSGEVLIGGKNVKEISLHELRDKIGVVLQESILFSGTIESNIKFGYHDATSEELDQAAINAQAMEFIQLKESGYQTEVEQRGKNLSGGQKQRVSIARTLIRKPQILILDDSSSALDMATESKLQGAIKEQMKGSTIIMIAQRISAVMDADQIIVLDQGQISGIGTHEELLKSNEIYRSIAISQLGEEAVNHE